MIALVRSENLKAAHTMGRRAVLLTARWCNQKVASA
jgi:hypothetical protein